MEYYRFFALIVLTSTNILFAQNSENMTADSDSILHYFQIPDYPTDFTSGTVAARFVDGLGFRYYWATDDLSKKDLQFKPSEGARTTDETLNHIYELTLTLKNAVTGKVNEGTSKVEQMSFEEKRRETLHNIKTASDVLKQSSDEDVASYKIIFKRTDGSTKEYPFWNVLNGPLADAVWHVGQVVSFRRSSGNPLNSKVSMFSGRLRQ